MYVAGQRAQDLGKPQLYYFFKSMKKVLGQLYKPDSRFASQSLGEWAQYLVADGWDIFGRTSKNIGKMFTGNTISKLIGGGSLPTFIGGILTELSAGEQIRKVMTSGKTATEIADMKEGEWPVWVRSAFSSFGYTLDELLTQIPSAMIGGLGVKGLSLLPTFAKWLSIAGIFTANSYLSGDDRSSAINGYATGGHIVGPGTDTSDDIPALLSNGEFVVNAKSARRNRRLLEAINSGSLQGFRYGTKAIARVVTGGGLGVDQGVDALQGEETFFETLLDRLENFNIADAIIALSETIKGWIEFIKGSPLYKNILEGVSGAFNTITNKKKSFDSQLNEYEGVEQNRFLARSLKEVGVKIAEKDLDNTPINSLKQFVASFKAINAAQKSSKEAAADGNKFIQRVQDSLIIDQVIETEKLLKNLRAIGEAANGDFIKGFEPAVIKDQFDLVKEAFEGLGLDLESFANLGVDVRKSLFAKAKEFEALELNISTIDQANASKAELEKFQEYVQQRSFLVESVLNDFSLKLGDALNAEELYSRAAANTGVQIQKELIRFLKPEELLGLDTLIRKIQPAFNTIKEGKTSPNFNKGLFDAAVARFTDLSLQIEDLMAKGATRGLANRQGFSEQLSQLNSSIDERSSNLLATDIVSAYDSEAKKLNATRIAIRKMDEGIEKDIANDQFYNKLDIFNDNLRRDVENVRNKSLEAGLAFEKSLSDGLQEGLKTVLGFVRTDKSLEETILDMMDVLTNSVIDAFTGGIIDGILGDGGIGKVFRDFGAGLFDFGKTPSKALKAGATDIATDIATKLDPADVATIATATTEASGATTSAVIAGNTQQVGLFAQLGSLLNNVLNSFINSISGFFGGSGGFDIGGSLSSFFGSGSKVSSPFGSLDFAATPELFGPGFASGGYIKGPGSGLSDSIPAMLSNGEFVVNAEATKKHMGLLRAVNAGQVRAFAEGGLVGKDVKTTNSRNSESKSQQFNINITGDVSRQTRKEVMKMIPEIASGTTRHDFDKRYR